MKREINLYNIFKTTKMGAFEGTIVSQIISNDYDYQKSLGYLFNFSKTSSTPQFWSHLFSGVGSETAKTLYSMGLADNCKTSIKKDIEIGWHLSKV